MSDTTSLSAQVDKLNITEGDVGDNNDTGNAPSELVAAVDDLITQLQRKFNSVSSEILGKMDEMSKRIDRLEASIQADRNSIDGADKEP